MKQFFIFTAKISDDLFLVIDQVFRVFFSFSQIFRTFTFASVAAVSAVVFAVIGLKRILITVLNVIYDPFLTRKTTISENKIPL